MSLATNLQDLATRVATEVKAVRTLVNGNAGDLSGLTTTAKTNLVAALNELKAAVDAVSGSSAGINDASTDSASTWSSTKIASEIDTAIDAVLGSGAAAALDTIGEIAAALGNDANAITTLTSGLANRVRFDAAQTLTAPQQVQARTNIGAVSADDVGDTNTDFVTTFEAGLV